MNGRSGAFSGSASAYHQVPTVSGSIMRASARHADLSAKQKEHVRSGSDSDVTARRRDVCFLRGSGRRWAENGHRSPEVRFQGQSGPGFPEPRLPFIAKMRHGYQ